MAQTTIPPHAQLFSAAGFTAPENGQALQVASLMRAALRQLAGAATGWKIDREVLGDRWRSLMAMAELFRLGATAPGLGVELRTLAGLALSDLFEWLRDGVGEPIPTPCMRRVELEAELALTTDQLPAEARQALLSLGIQPSPLPEAEALAELVHELRAQIETTAEPAAHLEKQASPHPQVPELVITRLGDDDEAGYELRTGDRKRRVTKGMALEAVRMLVSDRQMDPQALVDLDIGDQERLDLGAARGIIRGVARTFETSNWDSSAGPWRWRGRLTVPQ